MAAAQSIRKVGRVDHPDALGRRLWWRFLHGICWVWFKLCFRHRAWGQENIPATGGVIYLCNHQSFYDPIIVGLAAWRRPFYALARSTLFRVPGLGWLIHSLNAIPVDRGEADMAAMRRCLEALKQGYALLLFPEGTRTPDGTTKTFQTGTMLLIRRSGATVVPVAVEGAHEVWSKECKRPRWLGRIGVQYGPPVPAAELVKMEPAEALEMLRQKVETMRLEIRGRWR